MANSGAYQLEEWETTMENARHFNDLLIQLRMLGLPMVITLAVAGMVFNGTLEKVEFWVWGVPFASLIIAIVLPCLFLSFSI